MQCFILTIIIKIDFIRPAYPVGRMEKASEYFKMVNSIPKAVSIGFILAIAFGIAVGVGRPPAAYAKVDGEAASYLTSTKKKLKALRTELFANLSEEHQQIESKIDYEIRPIWRTRAFARHQGGYREVILYGGLIAVM